jgi:hypothetical protein
VKVSGGDRSVNRDTGKDVVPLNGKHLPYGFPDGVVKRALLFVHESGSVALGWRRLRAELEQGGMPVPDYHSVWNWVRDDAECFNAVTGPKKREMVAISEDVARLTAERLIQAIPNLSDGQAAVPYGIAMQKRTDWERSQGAGNADRDLLYLRVIVRTRVTR